MRRKKGTFHLLNFLFCLFFAQNGSADSLFKDLPANDSDVQAVEQLARTLIFKGQNCKELPCAKINCEEAKKLVQTLRDLEKILGSLDSWSKRAYRQADERYYELFDQVRGDAAKLEQFQRVMVHYTFFNELASAISDVLSVKDFLETVHTKIVGLDPEMLAALSGGGTSTAVLEKLMNVALIDQSIETLATITTRIEAYLRGYEGDPYWGNVIDVLNQIRSVLSEIRGTVQTLIELKKTGRDIMSSKGLTSIGQAVVKLGLVVSKWQGDKLLSRINELERDLEAEQKTLGPAFNDKQRLHVRMDRTTEALALLRQAQMAVGECIDKSCGSPSYTNLELPTSATWGAAFKNLIPLLQMKTQEAWVPVPGFYESENMSPSLYIDKYEFNPGETVEARYYAPQCMAKRSWLSVVSSEVQHGSSEINGKRAIGTIEQFNGVTKGTIKIKLPEKPGSYDLRMSDSERGAEFRSVTLKIKDLSQQYHLSFGGSMKKYTLNGDVLVLPDVDHGVHKEFPIEIIVVDKNDKTKKLGGVTVTAKPLANSAVSVYRGLNMITGTDGVARSGDQMPIVYDPKTGLQVVEVKAQGSENTLQIQIRGKSSEKLFALKVRPSSYTANTLKNEPITVHGNVTALANAQLGSDYALRVSVGAQGDLKVPKSHLLGEIRRGTGNDYNLYADIKPDPSGDFEFNVTSTNSDQSVTVPVSVYILDRVKFETHIEKNVSLTFTLVPDNRAGLRFLIKGGDGKMDGKQVRVYDNATNNYVGYFYASQSVQYYEPGTYRFVYRLGSDPHDRMQVTTLTGGDVVTLTDGSDLGRLQIRVLDGEKKSVGAKVQIFKPESPNQMFTYAYGGGFLDLLPGRYILRSSLNSVKFEQSFEVNEQQTTDAVLGGPIGLLKFKVINGIGQESSNYLEVINSAGEYVDYTYGGNSLNLPEGRYSLKVSFGEFKPQFGPIEVNEGVGRDTVLDPKYGRVTFNVLNGLGLPSGAQVKVYDMQGGYRTYTYGGNYLDLPVGTYKIEWQLSYETLSANVRVEEHLNNNATFDAGYGRVSFVCKRVSNGEDCGARVNLYRDGKFVAYTYGGNKLDLPTGGFVVKTHDRDGHEYVAGSINISRGVETVFSYRAP